jgi:hypothetical protein
MVEFFLALRLVFRKPSALIPKDIVFLKVQVFVPGLSLMCVPSFECLVLGRAKIFKPYSLKEKTSRKGEAAPLSQVVVKRIAIALFLLIPAVLILVFTVPMLGGAYMKNSNVEIFIAGEKSNHFPPLGDAYINLIFTKQDFHDDGYSLNIDVQVGCNQTASATFAFNNQGQESNDVTTCSMSRDVNSSITEGYGNLTASYLVWKASMDFGRHLKEFGAFSFPFDNYATENVIVAFNTSGLDSTHELVLADCFLNATVPVGFTATISNFVQLSNSETLSRLGNSYISVNFSAWQFSVTLLRSPQSLLLFWSYLVFPLIGVWSMFSITQISIPKPKDRIVVFAGALMATFAYLFSFRSLAPPTLTWAEFVVILLMGVWALSEIGRAVLSTLKVNTKHKREHLL